MVIAIKKLAPVQKQGERFIFRHWLADEMDARGLTTHTLAQHLQVSSSTVYQWTLGNQTPTIEACRRIAVAFGLDECIVREKVGRPSRINRLKHAHIVPLAGRKTPQPVPTPIRPETEPNRTSTALSNVLAELTRHIATESQNKEMFHRYAQAPGGEVFQETAREAEARWVALLFTRHLIKDELSKVGIEL